MGLSSGARLGPYEVVSLLGAGGMGEVYRARDPRLGRDVAVKILPSDVCADGDRMRRFEQEARAAAALNHPNVLGVLDLGAHDGSPYVVSELLEGDTLRARMAGAPLPLRKVLDYASQIAKGLAAAHEKGIVHRDLKPENLFVTKDGRVKILDFGLAKLTRVEVSPGERATDAIETGTAPGTVMGTVGYMSPEQVRGLPADHRSDIFSFGAVLYEMLSGRRAFRGETAAETMTAILREDPPQLAGVRRDVPPGLDRIVRRCLEKSVGERYQSAGDLAFNLEALSGLSGATVALPAPAARKRPPATLSFLLPVLAAVAGLYVGKALSQAPPLNFTQLAFRRGFVSSARFTPDGQTVVYSAAWEGRAQELFSTRIGALESRSLGLPVAADILSISSQGEMALLIEPRTASGSLVGGTLARASLAGGAPRDVLEDAPGADWAPDGSSLAVVHVVEGKWRLEFPPGKVLYEAPSVIVSPRVSPDGKLVAFVEMAPGGDLYGGSVLILDASGRRRAASSPLYFPLCAAWSAGGKEIWFTSIEGKGESALQALTPSGRQRLVGRFPGWTQIHDVFRDGRVLITINSIRTAIISRGPGDEKDRDLSWHDSSDLVDLSPDGKTLLLNETGLGEGPSLGVYLRKTDGSPAVRLGDGRSLALSPDGRWVLAVLRGPRAQLVLLPTGAGDQRRLPSGSVQGVSGASWFPDGQHFVFSGNAPGQAARLFVEDVAGDAPKPLTPEGVDLRFPLVSAAAGRIAASGPEGNVVLVPIEGGDPVPLAATLEGEVPIQWSPDGRLLYVFRPDALPTRVFEVEIASGRRRLQREMAIIDPTGVNGRSSLSTVAMTPDARSYAYSYSRSLNELHLVEGLR